MSANGTSRAEANARRRERYRQDPEYRERQRASSRKVAEGRKTTRLRGPNHTLGARFFHKIRVADVRDPDACWLWTGSTSRGYGQMWDGQRVRLAHIVAYELFNGPVLDGLELDHLCRVHACANPDHLEAVPHRENVLRGDATRRKTHCPQGHPYDEANTYVDPRGSQRCIECRRHQ